MPRPSSIAFTMLAKLSSVSTMSAASFETSVPVMPMATPILAALSAGASLMPSPVMATMWPLRCSAPTIRSLCSGSTRANTRTSSTIASSSASSMVAQVGAGHEASARLEDVRARAAIASAVAGWSPVIITVRMCARLATATAAFASVRGGSIMPTRPSNTRSSSMLSGSSIADVRPATASGSRPRAAAGTVRVAMARVRSAWPASASLRCRRVGPAVLVEDGRLAAFPYVPALREQDLRRALDEDAQVAGVVAIEMNGRVALALRRERDFRDAGKARELVRRYAELARRDDQRALGRIALHRPAAFAVRERRVVGERGSTQRSRHGIALRATLGKRHAVDGEVAFRDVAAAADLDQRCRP